MQTILGAGGAVGIPLAKELKKFTDEIRLVSRNPKKVNETDELYSADLTDLSQIEKAIQGSKVVYVTIGFEYKLSVWENIWPSFVKSVIIACKKYNSKLVFLDNAYMYDKAEISYMTEQARVNAPSKKGKVRQQLSELIMKEVKNKSLTALIARSADFYGPNTTNSALNIMVATRLYEGKKAQSFGGLNKIHTYTYTPDAGKAMALLGNSEDCYNQIWHLPTTKEKMTNSQWIELIAEELNVKAKVQTVSRGMVKFLGLFVPIMREFPEMMYQNEQDYVFDSSKFENRFNIAPTLPKEGIKGLIDSLRSEKYK
ncbi:MAG: NAD-dependent epimerase/dehydratase family protein [Crocinitomicaceae bacterium]